MTFAYYLFKYWHFVVIASLICLCVWFKVHYENKYIQEKEEHIAYREAVLIATIEAEQQRNVAQQKLQEEHLKQLQALRDELQDIRKQYDINRIQLDSLHKVVNNNKSSISTASHSSLVGYTSTLSDLFQECTSMVTDLAGKADEATASAVSYHSMLVSQKQIVDELNTDLAEDADEIQTIEVKE